MNWALGNSLYPQNKVAGPFHLLVPFPALPQPKKLALKSEPLPVDLPDYLVYVTRNALLTGTTSLTKVSTEAYEFFTKLCQFLAFERFMRSLAAWWMPGVVPSYLNGVQPWMMPTPQQQMLQQFWGVSPTPKPAVPQFPFAAIASQPRAVTSTQVPDYAAMMAIPTAFLALGPTLLEAWRVAS